MDIYYILNLIDVSTSITRLLDTERSDTNQLNTIAITSNASTSNAEFELSKTQIRNFSQKTKSSKLISNDILKIIFEFISINKFIITIYDFQS